MMRGLLPTKRNEDFERLLVRLRNKWQPLVRPAQDLQCQKLEIDHSHIKWGGATRRTSLPGDSESLTNGEIFRVEEGIVIVTLGEEDTGGRLRFKEDGKGGIIAVEPDEGDTLKVEVSALVHAGELEVLDIVSEAALEDLEITLEPYRYENSRFAEIKGDVVAEELPSNQTHVMAARALLSRTARTLAVAVKSARGILARDAQRHVPDGVDAAPIWDSLITAGVLERDVVIVCNTTRANCQGARQGHAQRPGPRSIALRLWTTHRRGAAGNALYHHGHRSRAARQEPVDVCTRSKRTHNLRRSN